MQLGVVTREKIVFPDKAERRRGKIRKPRGMLHDALPRNLYQDMMQQHDFDPVNSTLSNFIMWVERGVQDHERATKKQPWDRKAITSAKSERQSKSCTYFTKGRGSSNWVRSLAGCQQGISDTSKLVYGKSVIFRPVLKQIVFMIDHVCVKEIRGGIQTLM